MTTVPMYLPAHLKPTLMFVGQAPSDEELRKGEPLVGPAGREFNRLLRIAGIPRPDCAITNVFNEPIENHDIEAITLETKDLRARIKAEELAYQDYDLPPIKRGRYLEPTWRPHLERLAGEIEAVSPNLVVPLGDEALWALTGRFGISSFRGSVGWGEAPWLHGKVKILPTFHPAYVLRNYTSRIHVIADLIKAKKEARTPDIVLPMRKLWLNPTLDDIRRFKSEHLDNAELISVDIETARGQITCIAFAPSPFLAICIPFTDYTCGFHYWKTAEDERAAYLLVKEICEGPAAKLLQNGSYDAQWLWVKWRVALRNYRHDTRLLHHALYPELPKSLEVLGSLYENESAWKQMRERKATKRDE